MPELAEVERARKEIEILAKPGVAFISKVVAFEDNIVFAGCTGAEFSSAILGKKVISAGRKGKNFYLELDSAPHPVFHLGMSGSTQILGMKATTYRLPRSRNQGEWPPKYCKATITFSEYDGENGSTSEIGEWSFSDSRRLGKIRLTSSHPLDSPPISLLGADPYLEMPSLPILSAQILKSKAPIKSLFLNQNGPLCGIGNWMVDEMLFQAKIHPEHPSHLLSTENLETLWNEIQNVTNTAVQANANSSLFPSTWLFKHRWGKGKKNQALMTLPDGSQSEISFITVGGRTSAIIESVQFLPAQVQEVMNEKIRIASARKAEKMAKEELKDEEVEEGNEEIKSKKSPRKKREIKEEMELTASEEEMNDTVSPYFKKSSKSKSSIDLSDPLASPSKSTKASPAKIDKEVVVKEKKVRRSKKVKIAVVEEEE